MAEVYRCRVQGARAPPSVGLRYGAAAPFGREYGDPMRSLPLCVLAWALAGVAAEPGSEETSSELPDFSGELGRAPLSAWEALDLLAPRAAWDLSVHVNYSTVAHFGELPWVGFGLGLAWGRIFGVHRLGAGLRLNLEGPVPIYFSSSLEPQVQWDAILGGVQVGASLGPALLLHTRALALGSSNTLGVAPMAAVRVGWSQRWRRASRRFFVVLEPKVRWVAMERVGEAPVDWAPDVGVGIVVGSGRGTQ